MTVTPRYRPLLLASLSLVVLAACGKSKDDSAAKADDAKSDAATPDAATPDAAKPAEDGKPAVAAGTPPKGKGAADNLKPLVDAVAGLEGCKIDEENDEIAGECPGLDKFDNVIAEQEDQKAVQRTLVNLLAEPNDTVRWVAVSELTSSDWNADWNDDSVALISTALVALATEKHRGVARMLASDIGYTDDEILLKEPILTGLISTLTKLADIDAFTSLIPSSSDAEGYATLLAAAAKQNPTLENRAYAMDELLRLDKLHVDACATGAELAIALSKEPPIDDPESDAYNFHYEANGLIYSLRDLSITEGEKVQDCAAVLPGLIDEITAQATAGSLSAEVFDGVLGIEHRDDAKTYTAKLQALAEAVVAGKYDDDMQQKAKYALEDWKSAE